MNARSSALIAPLAAALLAGQALAQVAIPTSAPAAPPAATPAAAPAPAPAPAPGIAGRVNEQLPEWVRFGGEYRFRVEGSTNAKGVEAADDLYVLSRLRVDLLFKLGPHVRLFVQGQDSQAGGFNANPDPPVHQNDFDLRQAWVEVRQSDKQGWALRVGRQELAYGDQRLVGSLNWTNTARAFDAAKLTYTDPRVAVDVFASSVVAIQDDVFDKHLDGQNFYGAHASFFKAVPKAQLDTYAFWKTAPRVLGELASAGDADTVTFGARLAGGLATRADYTVEVAGQRGSFAADDIRAAALHTRLGWAFSKRPEVPKLRLEYNFASGDDDPADGVRGTFDQLYPTGHAKYGVIDQVGLKNMHNARAGVILKPHARVTLEADYHSFWLASRTDGLYDAGGNLVARVPTGAATSHVAQELDVQLSLTVAPGVTFGAGYGHWIPGGFWREATPGAARDFAYSFVTYKF